MKKNKTIFLFVCLLCFTAFVNAQSAKKLTPEQQATQQRLATERARRSNTEVKRESTHTATVATTSSSAKSPVVDQQAIDKMNADVKQRHEAMSVAHVAAKSNAAPATAKPNPAKTSWKSKGK